MSTSRGAVVFVVAVSILCFLSLPALAGTQKKNPSTYTCEELTDVEIDYVPQVVYWIDGYNWAGEPDVDVGIDWFAVPVNDIYIDCKKNPTKPAAEVIKKHSKKKAMKK